MPPADELHSLVKKYWGFDTFRKPQLEIIQAAIAGHDVLGIMPTGGGKSLCYQLAGLARGGLTLVISPLIALMQDQVGRLVQMGLSATYINSTLSIREVDARLNEAIAGKWQFLYLAPERLSTAMLKARLAKMDVRLLAVDEAHCISQWGYDFRPAYLEIRNLREALPNVPIMALTASATPEVRQDIADQLELRAPAVFVSSFYRKNLRFVVLYDDDKNGKVLDILNKVPGAAIIYVRTRSATHHMAGYLKSRGISAAAYHAGLPYQERQSVQNLWLQDEIRVIIATTAFGMGIDKADVRVVIHYHLPLDLEDYYQGAGRAGRDGKTAYNVLFFSPKEANELSSLVGRRYPDFKTVSAVYETICNACGVDTFTVPDCSFPLDLDLWRTQSGYSNTTILYALQILDTAKVIILDNDASRYDFIRIDADDETLLRVQEQPKFKKLLELMLREMGGEAFTRYVRCETNKWSAKLNIPIEELKELLIFLTERNMIQFRPARDEPALQFLTPRHPLTPEQLNWHLQEVLHRQAVKRMAAVIEYAGGTDRCRNKILLEYFGEHRESNCGTCDVCTKRHNPELDAALLHKIEKEVQELLRQKRQVAYHGLIDAITYGTIPQRERAIRRMLAQELLVFNEDYALILR